MTKKCPVMKAFNIKGEIVNVYCGTWDCKRCGKVNAQMWAWRVRIQIEIAPGTTYFWTLTLGAKYRNSKEGFAALNKLWDTFRKMVQRRVGKWTYCAFVEGQPKRGDMPHFHIISLQKAPFRLKDMAAKAGFGYMAKEKPITSKKAANYVAKYTTKGFENAPKRFRRVRTSRDWSKLPDFQGDPLLVKGNKENLTDYLLRVANETDVAIDTLLDRWQLANEID